LGRPDFINAAQLVLKEDAVLQNVEHSRFDLTISVDRAAEHCISASQCTTPDVHTPPLLYKSYPKKVWLSSALGEHPSSTTVHSMGSKALVEQIAQKTRHREEVYLVWSCFVLQHAPTNHFTKAFAIGAEKVSQLQVEMSSDAHAFYFTYPNFSRA